MQIQIDDRPSYAMAKVALDPGEEIVAEGGATVAMTEGFEWETKARRGFLKPIARSTFGGEDEGSVATTTDLQPMWLESAGTAWHDGMRHDCCRRPCQNAEAPAETGASGGSPGT